MFCAQKLYRTIIFMCLIDDKIIVKVIDNKKEIKDAGIFTDR